MRDKTYRDLTLTEWAAYFKYKETAKFYFTNIITKKYE